MDQGKEESSKSLERSNSSKKKKLEKASDQVDDKMEQAWKRLKTETTTAQFQKMDTAAKAGNKETEGTKDSDEFEELLDGTETEYSEEETVLSPKGSSEEFEVFVEYKGTETVLSPKESSTNNPKGMKKKKKKNVEQAAENNQEEASVLPKGMKKKRVREEEEEDKEKTSKGDSSSADTCTSKLHTSLDFDKGESMRSPPGDQGSSCRKNL